MIGKQATDFSELSTVFSVHTAKGLGASKVETSPATVAAAIISVLAGVGSGLAALSAHTQTLSPLWAAGTMTLMAFAGCYLWALFTHLVDRVFFGSQTGYRQTLDVFWKAYAFQALTFLCFTRPLGWLWTWIAAYLTIVAWGFIASRRLGMRPSRAIVTATLGLLVWFACQTAWTLLVKWDGLYLGVGAFLV
jgi:hypothetical protein